jgi:GcrA cell cycle regulator
MNAVAPIPQTGKPCAKANVPRFTQSRSRCGGGPSWTEERDAVLIELFEQGFSFGRIAEQFGDGTTRSAVIGRAHRLGLRVRDAASKIIREAKRYPAVRAPALKVKPRLTAFGTEPKNGLAGLARLPKRKNPRPEISRPEPPLAPESRLLTLLEIEHSHCKWPVGDPRQETFRYCAADRNADQPYCAYHWHVAHREPTT